MVEDFGLGPPAGVVAVPVPRRSSATVYVVEARRFDKPNVAVYVTLAYSEAEAFRARCQGYTSMVRHGLAEQPERAEPWRTYHPAGGENACAEFGIVTVELPL